MSNPASVADVEQRWRPLSPSEQARTLAFLDDAWWLLTGRRPGLVADMAAGRVSEQNVIRVIAAMTLRVLKNPDGWVEESLDDWRGRRSELVASGVLAVTNDELADVTPRRAASSSVRLVVPGDV